MISNARFHGRGHAERLMNPCTIVVREMQAQDRYCLSWRGSISWTSIYYSLTAEWPSGRPDGRHFRRKAVGPVTTSLNRQLNHTISPNQNFKSFNIIFRRWLRDFPACHT